MKQGFSLVELSIVLVILGLLTGGILAGQSLIRAAELRSISSDFSRYQTAVLTFRDQYFALPGDMRNATAFWGDDNAVCPDAAIANGTPGTCNGNGDGALGSGTVNPSEFFRAWQQLALAGLIEGTYTGIAGAADARQAIIGTNVPRSRIANAGSSFYNEVYTSAHPNRFINASGKNLIQFGAASGLYETYYPVIKPEEAWNIDTKMDDGRPGSGGLMAWKPSGSWTCSTSADPTTATYNLADTTNGCNFDFVLLP